MSEEHERAVADALRDRNTPELIRRGVNTELRFLDLHGHLQRQCEFSFRTFGPPNNNSAGVIDHIRKELIEIEDDPLDLYEWIDVVILALDGALRAGYSPAEIVYALEAKQTKNEGRRWPDYRTAEPGKAIEHIRGEE